MTASSIPVPGPLQTEVHTLWPETVHREWTALTPDGSDRTYWRLGSPGDTVVLMVYRGQNATPVEGFLEVHRLLESTGLPVARILQAHPETGVFLIEDLGDTPLESAAPADLDALYDQAIELLARIQRIPPAPGPRLRCFELAFDAAKLGLEMDFFFQHLVSGLLGLDPQSPMATAARRELNQLCDWLGSEHPVLAHRDYHSRNLMVHNGKLRLIDYQDARMGRRTYDLASLLYDSYQDLGEDRRSRLLDLYETMAPAGPLPASWREELRPMAIQRNLKALGSFGYLMTRKGKLHFASSIASTLSHLYRHLRDGHMPATQAFVLGPLKDRCAERGLLGSGPA